LPIPCRPASKQKEASGQSVPEMGFSDVILEKDGRRFRNRISKTVRLDFRNLPFLSEVPRLLSEVPF